MAMDDLDLGAREDGVGRRGEVGRRGFVRMGVIGAFGLETGGRTLDEISR